jgi:glycosyltransferase involved in cell wall biosynthesis
MDVHKEVNSLSIILPCYNPLSNWAQSVVDNIQSLQSLLGNVDLELIIVNDGSQKHITDKDIELIQHHIPSFQFIDRSFNRGKGFTLRQGVEKAQNDICIYTDIDFPYTEKSFHDVYLALVNGKTDVAVGVRKANYYDHVPFVRRFISKTLRFLIRAFLRMSISDTQCGIKGFSKAGKHVFLQTQIDRYLFDLEFVFLATHDPAIKMDPVEVTLKPGIIFSKVNARILFSESISFLRLFVRSIGSFFR